MQLRSSFAFAWRPALASITFLLFAREAPLRAQRSVPDESILKYLNQTITWYRDITALGQSPADPRERLLADDVRESSIQAVRSAFEFARAQAAIPPPNAPEPGPTDSGRGRNLAQAVATADQRAVQAQAQIEKINRELENASAKARPGLLAQRDEVTSELNFDKIRRDTLRNLLGFLSAPGEAGLGAKIADLERSVPEITAMSQKTSTANSPVAAAPLAQAFHPESEGLVALTADVFSSSRKMNRLNRLVQNTDALLEANQKLRAPLRAALQDLNRRADAVTEAPDATDPQILDAQRKQLDTLAARFKQLSASTVPLSEQSTQIGGVRGTLIEWHGDADGNYRDALRYLILRAGMLALGLALIFGFSEVWRRATMRYVSDLRRRRQLLLLRRIVVGCTIALFLILSFVTEFGSLATFAGFSAAGIAVAMQSVILSMVAYFFLVGRWGVRVGDRVTVSGVTGDVVDVGLFRLYLMELAGSEPALEPTGRIVVFPNSVFFQPAAVYKQVPGVDYAWRTLNLRLRGTADSAEIEQRLLAAIESVYAEYRETLERQHRAAQSSLNLHTPVPRLESRVHLIDSGVEIFLRYPVDIRRAREIEDRIHRQVMREVDRDPRLSLMDNSPSKLGAKIG